MRRSRFAVLRQYSGKNGRTLEHEMTDQTCTECQRPLIEIDHYGERLIGCIECNHWGWLGGDKPFMVLPEDDLQALSNLSDARHKADDTTP